MTIFRTAHYGADGTLVRVSEAFPTEAHHDPQTVADLCARAADTGCTYQAGAFLVWADIEVRPGALVGQHPRADGMRAYGGQHSPVPAHRFRSWT